MVRADPQIGEIYGDAGWGLRHYATTWKRLFTAGEFEPKGFLALVDGKPVGLVHYLYHRSCWSLVNNYADMVDDTARATNASITQSSSWWLISAYNSAWGTGTNTANLSNGDDFVKVLSSITTMPGGTVGEPGSLAMAGLALLGAFAARRKVIGK